MTLPRRTRGPLFYQRLVWPQPVIMAMACNFPHIRFPQYQDVFHQLHRIEQEYINKLRVATFGFYVGPSSTFTSFQEIHGDYEV